MIREGQSLMLNKQKISLMGALVKVFVEGNQEVYLPC